ncbi:MAG TPA: 1-(5-phosphoribosyl)-5-[(5-phosphoribosylamino)methylideneamino]imidazole-4-carboxamide isomerase [Xanthomonadales bacterium]|nr:1-(5-phosphoribosyl)-5-[(5-phosphoribosylamino)methylideneamino]imidazole-4-carboxamide isomerase [Xanthomonadales bacterium]
MSFTVYPAIDVRAGAVVRLERGDYDRETRYGDDPLAQARSYRRDGARWLHLVDLDAARAGGYTLMRLLAAIVAETGLQVQTGGGVRAREDVAALLGQGAARVVIGSLAVRAPDQVCAWLREFGPDRLTIALDTRRDPAGEWRLPVRGWTESGGERLFDLLATYRSAGLRHLLCTDIDRDGMLSGPNVDLYRAVRDQAPELALQASGGVRSVADIAAAAAAGCAGAVLGRALLEARFRLPDALTLEAAC